MPVCTLSTMSPSSRSELEHVAVLEDEDALLADAGLSRQTGVEVLHAVLAVHRDEVLRAQEVEHHAHVLLRGVPGHVDAAGLAVDDVRARP